MPTLGDEAGELRADQAGGLAHHEDSYKDRQSEDDCEHRDRQRDCQSL
jgi:hypothetical protein